MPAALTPARLVGALVALVALATLGGAPPASAATPAGAAARKVLMQRSISPKEVEARLARYPKVQLGTTSRVPDDVKAMLPHLRRAADAVDRVYWQQMSATGLQMRAALRASGRFEGHALAQRFLQLLERNYGPWDRHHDDAPFLGRQRRPAGANFYPADISKRELDAWVRKLPSAAPGLYSPYTVIRRSKRKLQVVPYSKAFARDLKAAAKALTAASQVHRCVEPDGPSGGGDPHDAKCRCAGLARFLEARAASFLNDDYLTSEILWMETGACPLDIAIGPYEYYEDRLLGLKTSFEAIVYLRDKAESNRLAGLLKHHAALVAGLPLAPDLKPRFELTKPSPITIADVLYTAGDARSGYQIRAFVLPNDEAVRRARGTKNVILRNVVRAKFDSLAQPVARRIFGKKLLRHVTFDAYYDILLAWQFAHGIQASRIEVAGGGKTTARKLLRARYPVIELVKGEAIALLNVMALRDKKLIGKVGDKAIAATFLAGFFDSMRLGRTTPQTTAKAIIYNYLAKEWVYRYNPSQRTFEVNPPALRSAIRKLTAETLQIIGRGDYAGAGRMIMQYGLPPGEVHAKLAELGDLPVDIQPDYVSMPR